MSTDRGTEGVPVAGFGVDEKAVLTGLDVNGAATTAAAEPHRLDLDAIDYRVGGNDILKAVSLRVRPRQIVSLLGPSGCGKTSLLRVAAGIARQSAGSVRVGGRVMADGRTFVPAETRPLGLVFQDLALFPHLRIEDNVAYGLKGRRGGKALAREALESVGLGGFGRAYPHQLSGGEQQRVALVRALLPAPEVVLFDEPFSGLDRGLRGTVRDETVALLRRREATAVIVTHDPEEALSVSDTIALMRGGQIVQVGTPQEIWRRPVDLKAAQVFSHVNVFSARARGGMADTAVGPIPLDKAVDGDAIAVAFRPEALKVLDGESREGVEAIVESRRFFGDHMEITGRVGGAVVVLRADPYVASQAEKLRILPDVRQAIVWSAPAGAPQ